MIRNKLLDGENLYLPSFRAVSKVLETCNYGEMRDTRYWEYPAAIVFSGMLNREEPHPRVLDAACGYTPFTPLLAVLGCTVDAVDVDGKTARASRDMRLGGLRDKVKQYDMAMEDMSFEDEVFDYVFCISGVGYAENDTDAVVEMTRCMKQDGVMILTLTMAEKTRGFIGDKSPRIYDNNFRKRLMAPAKLRCWDGVDLNMDGKDIAILTLRKENIISEYAKLHGR